MKNQIKILTIIGARPQIIKAATLSNAIKKFNLNNSLRIKEIILHTGQHFDKNMSDIFFIEMSIPAPAYNLNISNLSHGAMTGRMVEKIEEILILEKPDWVVVYGDTNSTLSAALAASKTGYPIAHIESGLRSFNFNMPEEINRIITDRLSLLLFCPTQTACTNLKQEGFPFFLKDKEKQQIIDSGDIMYETVQNYKEKTNFGDLEKWGIKEKEFVLFTLHRQENLDNPNRIESIFRSLNKISNEIPILFPTHPVIEKKINLDKLIKSSGFIITSPLSYIQSILLQQTARIVITDSGGLQKEAYFCNTPCITLRDETEWVETLKKENNLVVGCDEELIINAFLKQVNKISIRDEDFPFGLGNTTKIIIEKFFS